jgi:hypothetical protein
VGRTLIATADMEIDGRTYAVHYYVQQTMRGGRRYSCEVQLGADDRIILDDDSMMSLESKVTRLAPATVESRLLAARGSEAA